MNDLTAYTHMPETNQLVAEASTLGWAPGLHPLHIRIDGVTYFYHKARRNEDGDTTAFLYRPDCLVQSGGIFPYAQVVVYND